MFLSEVFGLWVDILIVVLEVEKIVLIKQSIPSLHHGFTLAELLIALAILGVIAAFTIPKVLLASESEKYNAIAKEAASMMSGAYQTYKLSNQPSSNVQLAWLTAYINYIKTDSTTLIDVAANQAGTTDCANAIYLCLKLHNGSILLMPSPGTVERFGGTTYTHGIPFSVDPNGRLDGGSGSEGKSVRFILYYDGKLRTWGTMENNTTDSTGNMGPPIPSRDPSWFSWN